MKGELVQHILSPLKKDDWFVIITNNNTYTLRLGGYKIENIKIRFEYYSQLFINLNSSKIKEIYSDDFWVFIILENENILSFGEISIDSEGDSVFGIQLDDYAEFKETLLENNCLYRLVTSENGWSAKVKI